MRLVPENRDLRVDFFRGLSLWFIFVDHVPGNILGFFTIRNATLSDATEIFVMLAGYAAGLAYGRNLDRHGWLHTGADVVSRAWTLWVAHILLFVVFAAQVGLAARTFGSRAYLAEIGFDHLIKTPHRALLDALLLRYQPAYLNVLPMYIVILLGFAMLVFSWHRPDLRPLLPKTLLRVVLGIDKSALHPFRLISILCLTWLTIRLVPVHAAWLRLAGARLFILIGQFGLPVFCFGVFFAFLGRLALELGSGPLTQLGVNITGLAGLALVAAVPAWYRAKEQMKHQPEVARGW